MVKSERRVGYLVGMVGGKGGGIVGVSGEEGGG